MIVQMCTGVHRVLEGTVCCQVGCQAAENRLYSLGLVKLLRKVSEVLLSLLVDAYECKLHTG